ncbi:MAG: hypothetical protein DCC65_09640 [Planctomycetota bacterium]|nr:MAG: hypothetical protein DCC65_09640 [Planctomycetota bacterium]
MPPTKVVTLDRYTRGILTALTVLLAVIAIELWAGRPSDLPAAQAQIPDTGLQRKIIADEAQRTNQLLEQILEHLQSKPIRVRVVADESSGTKRSSSRAAGR